MAFSKRSSLGFAVILLVFSDVALGQMFLTPEKENHGYFTNDSFFITCYTADPTIEKLHWIGNDQSEITATEGRIFIQPAINMQKGLELVFQSVQMEDAGKYTCSDVQDSISFQLNVYRSISFYGTESVQNAPEGENAVLKCHAKANPEPAVGWYFSQKKLQTDFKHVIGQDKLTIMNVSRADAGTYRCRAIVVTPHGSQMKDMKIAFHVQYKPEWAPDMETLVYVTLGSLAKLVCSASADPEPMFQWIFRGEVLHNSSDNMIFNNESTSILQLTAHDKTQLGEYVCQVYNQLGTSEKSVELKEGNPPHPPHLAVQSEEQGELVLQLKKRPGVHDELAITGYKVEYILTSEKWDQATSVEFSVDEPYVLRNMSYNSKYILRATARNAAGYGEYSDEVAYMTQSLQVAPVVSDSNTGRVLMLPTAIIIIAHAFGLISYFELCDMWKTAFGFTCNLI